MGEKGLYVCFVHVLCGSSLGTTFFTAEYAHHFPFDAGKLGTDRAHLQGCPLRKPDTKKSLGMAPPTHGLEKAVLKERMF